MSVVYDGSHSISFIKTNSGGTNEIKKTWDDWHLIPAERPIVNPPQPALSLISIPGSSNVLDLTEVLGSINYSMRTGEWEFYVDNDQWVDWPEAFNTISQFVNGQRLKCVLNDDPTKVYRGRFTFSGWKNGDSYSSVTIKYDLEYYYDTASLQSISGAINQNGRILNSNLPKEAFRDLLTVTANYGSGVSYVVKDYSITSVANSTVSLSYENKTASVSYYSSLDTVVQIEAIYRQPDEDLYVSTDIDALKYDLIVYAVYNTGRKDVITNYSLGGTLSVGRSIITVYYGSLSTTFDVWCSKARLEYISAIYSSGTHAIYIGDSLDSLKPYLTVTASYNDSTTSTVPSSNYSLSGTLVSGTSVITVGYLRKITTFSVNVIDNTLNSISAVYSPGYHTVYVGDSLDSLKPYLTVTASYNDSTTSTVPSSNYSLSGTLVSGTSVITVDYLGKTTTLNIENVETGPREYFVCAIDHSVEANSTYYYSNEQITDSSLNELILDGGNVFTLKVKVLSDSDEGFYIKKALGTGISDDIYIDYKGRTVSYNDVTIDFDDRSDPATVWLSFKNETNSAKHINLIIYACLVESGGS